MTEAPYGMWDSPITAEMASSAIVAFQDVAIDGEDIYWSEMRPTENGRYAIVKYSKGSAEEMLPLEFNARTRVHEYGGAAFTVHQGTIYFTNFKDQRLYRLEPKQKPEVLTKEGLRFAECKVTAFGIVAIAEAHDVQNHEPKNFIALINLQTGDVKELVTGADFYSSIAISQDQKKIAWIAWDHPNMPWDNTQLWVADLTEKGISHPERIDADTVEQAFFQPQWGPNNELIVVSDKSNWWNLYQVHGQKLELIFSVESEIGQPLWNLGASTWGYYENSIVCTFFQQGKSQLFVFKGEKLTPFDIPYNSFSQIRSSNNKIAFIAGAPNKPTIVGMVDNGHFKVLRENMAISVEAKNLSAPEHITFNSNGRPSHAFYYAPQNKSFAGLKGTLPPLIVRSHGGPTANCGSNLNLDIQYWTSRGFAFVDVNYAGSTGYGREYRKSLERNWGIYDVEDCAAAALYLAEKGLVDMNKLAITGGSAGGYTTLAALAFTTTFHVGASHYGVSDLAALVKETHKFESRYLDNLIGPYPQEKAKYDARTPLFHIEGLNAPVIFFQGDEDKIVLPNQAEMMYAALKEKGIMTEYWLFKGEQHGFRKADNRITALEEQRKFFIKALGLDK